MRDHRSRPPQRLPRLSQQLSHLPLPRPLRHPCLAMHPPLARPLRHQRLSPPPSPRRARLLPHRVQPQRPLPPRLRQPLRLHRPHRPSPQQPVSLLRHRPLPRPSVSLWRHRPLQAPHRQPIRRFRLQPCRMPRRHLPQRPQHHLSQHPRPLSRLQLRWKLPPVLRQRPPNQAPPGSTGRWRACSRRQPLRQPPLRPRLLSRQARKPCR